MISGNTFIKIGDREIHLGHNDSIPLGEAKVLASLAMGLDVAPYKYLAIGSGKADEFVDSENPPKNSYIIEKYFSIAGRKNKLFSEFYRVPLYKSVYIDADGEVTKEVTPTVQLIWKIPNTDAVGIWRELAIFGGDATGEQNSGEMVHYQTIVDLRKTESLFSEDIEFHWRVDFSPISALVSLTKKLTDCEAGRNIVSSATGSTTTIVGPGEDVEPIYISPIECFERNFLLEDYDVNKIFLTEFSNIIMASANNKLLTINLSNDAENPKIDKVITVSETEGELESGSYVDSLKSVLTFRTDLSNLYTINVEAPANPTVTSVYTAGSDMENAKVCSSTEGALVVYSKGSDLTFRTPKGEDFIEETYSFSSSTSIVDFFKIDLGNPYIYVLLDDDTLRLINHGTWEEVSSFAIPSTTAGLSTLFGHKEFIIVATPTNVHLISVFKGVTYLVDRMEHSFTPNTGGLLEEKPVVETWKVGEDRVISVTYGTDINYYSVVGTLYKYADQGIPAYPSVIPSVDYGEYKDFKYLTDLNLLATTRWTDDTRVQKTLETFVAPEIPLPTLPPTQSLSDLSLTYAFPTLENNYREPVFLNNSLNSYYFIDDSSGVENLSQVRDLGSGYPELEQNILTFEEPAELLGDLSPSSHTNLNYPILSSDGKYFSFITTMQTSSGGTPTYVIKVYKFVAPSVLELVTIYNTGSPQISGVANVVEDSYLVQGVYTGSGYVDSLISIREDGDLNIINLDTNIETSFVIDVNISFLGTIDTPGYVDGIVFSSDETKAYIVVGSSGLQILDMTNPVNPSILGTIDTPGIAVGIALSSDETKAYIADRESGLQIIDVSNPSNLSIIGSFDTPSASYNLVLSSDETKAYITTFFSGLYIVDISNPSSPSTIGSIDTPGATRGIALSSDETKAYIADGEGGLQIIDITNPTDPSIIGSIDTPSASYNLVLSSDETKAYLATNSSGLQIIDVSNPSNLSIIGTTNTSEYMNNLVLSSDETKVYANGESLLIIDVSDPSNPSIIDSADTPGASKGIALFSDETKVYTANGNYYDIRVYDINLVRAYSELQPFRYSTSTWLLGYVGTLDGNVEIRFTSFSSVTGSYSGLSQIYSDLYRLYIKDDTLYTVSGNNLHIYSVTDLINSPGLHVDKVLNTVQYSSVTFINTSLWEDFDNNVIALRHESQSGVVFYDITDPINPVEITTVDFNTLLSSSGKDVNYIKFTEDLVIVRLSELSTYKYYSFSRAELGIV